MQHDPHRDWVWPVSAIAVTVLFVLIILGAIWYAKKGKCRSKDCEVCPGRGSFDEAVYWGGGEKEKKSTKDSV